MWKLKSIDIENIVSFHKASFSVAQNVATLIFGRNEDNDSQPCNGSGKSSLIEAISFALTGEQLRKVKTLEEIINDSKDSAKVSLVLSNHEKERQMTIVRKLSRQGSQQVQVIVQTGPYDSDTEEIIQPTVADYNKYILSEIGLTKDEIYNYFILCDNKFESFFDCSDKGKKEIINNFSNGIIIDEGIERLHADLDPLNQQYVDQSAVVASINGSISALESEIDNSKEKEENAQKERETRLERLDKQIQEARQNIEDAKSASELAGKRLDELQVLQDEIDKLEQSGIPLLQAYKTITELSTQHDIPAISDFPSISQGYNNKLETFKFALSTSEDNMALIEKKLANAQASYDKVKLDYTQQESENQKLDEADKAKCDQIIADIKAIDHKLDVIDDEIKEAKKAGVALETEISQLQSLLKTAVVCPKCEHKFLAFQNKTYDEVVKRIADLSDQVADNRETQANFEADFTKYDAQAAAKENEVENIENAISQRKKSLEYSHKGLKELDAALDEIKESLNRERQSHSSTETEIEKVTAKIEILRNRMFGEIVGMLDGLVAKAQATQEQSESNVAFYNGQLSQYRKALLDLQNAPAVDFATSLKASLTEYQAKYEKAEKELNAIQGRINQLKVQEVNFTLFKSHIARKKIDALALIVNDFLEKIGSDIRLKLEGFSVTKKGKLQDKISVQVFRDGADCGSYQKFSGGEKARLNLACILSLHALTNANCDEGKGLDFLIIDELLDKSDEVGIATYCEALNKLKQTALLITQGAVSEGYPHKLLVTKRQGVSTLN